MVDEKVLRAALEGGMKAVACVACHQMTLYIENESKTNTPSFCGRIACYREKGHPMAVYVQWGPA